jgi:hypothetical protein
MNLRVADHGEVWNVPLSPEQVSIAMVDVNVGE